MAHSVFTPVMDDTAQRLGWKSANFLYSGLGLAGSVRVADTATHTGKFWIFHAIADCVISAITYDTDGGSGGAAAGDTIKAGDRIYGQISSIKLTSGTGELYRAAML